MKGWRLRDNEVQRMKQPRTIGTSTSMYRSRVPTWEFNDVVVSNCTRLDNSLCKYLDGISNRPGVGFDSDESTSGC